MKTYIIIIFTAFTTVILNNIVKEGWKERQKLYNKYVSPFRLKKKIVRDFNYSTTDTLHNRETFIKENIVSQLNVISDLENGKWIIVDLNDPNMFRKPIYTIKNKDCKSYVVAKHISMICYEYKLIKLNRSLVQKLVKISRCNNFIEWAEKY